MHVLIRQIARAAEDIDGIATLVVFGSRAAGRPRDDSNLDIAVLPSVESPAERRALISKLASALAHIPREARVDVVLLDEAPEVVRHRIMSTGIIAIQHAARRWQALRVLTMREHGDREHYRLMLRTAQRRRLTERNHSGRTGRALESLERTRGVSYSA